MAILSFWISCGSEPTGPQQQRSVEAGRTQSPSNRNLHKRGVKPSSHAHDPSACDFLPAIWGRITQGYPHQEAQGGLPGAGTAGRCLTPSPLPDRWGNSRELQSRTKTDLSVFRRTKGPHYQGVFIGATIGHLAPTRRNDSLQFPRTCSSSEESGFIVESRASIPVPSEARYQAEESSARREGGDGSSPSPTVSQLAIGFRSCLGLTGSRQRLGQ